MGSKWGWGRGSARGRGGCQRACAVGEGGDGTHVGTLCAESTTCVTRRLWADGLERGERVRECLWALKEDNDQDGESAPTRQEAEQRPGHARRFAVVVPWCIRLHGGLQWLRRCRCRSSGPSAGSLVRSREHLGGEGVVLAKAKRHGIVAVSCHAILRRMPCAHIRATHCRNAPRLAIPNVSPRALPRPLPLPPLGKLALCAPASLCVALSMAVVVRCEAAT